jgi:release factor glutamine methyltransferase
MCQCFHGSHTGTVSEYVCQIVGSLSAHHGMQVYLSTDVNPHACRCTRATGVHNNVSLRS